jgi:hypothetical protein
MRGRGDDHLTWPALEDGAYTGNRQYGVGDEAVGELGALVQALPAIELGEPHRSAHGANGGLSTSWYHGCQLPGFARVEPRVRRERRAGHLPVPVSPPAVATVSRIATISKPTTMKMGQSAETAWTSRTAPLRARPVHRGQRGRDVGHLHGRGLHRDLPGQRGRLATCCRTRPQRRPFVPVALWYRNWPDRPVWPRVRREGGDAVQASAGAAPHLERPR